MVTCTGSIPGVCYSPNMTVGHSYVILAMLDKDDGKYRPSDAEFDASDQQLLKRLATACGLQAVYPHGMYARVTNVKLCSACSLQTSMLRTH